jgi:hypothetical protein
MTTLTIGKRIAIIFAILGIALAGVGFFAINRLVAISRNSDSIVHDAIPGIALMGRINAARPRTSSVSPASCAPPLPRRARKSRTRSRPTPPTTPRTSPPTKPCRSPTMNAPSTPA